MDVRHVEFYGEQFYIANDDLTLDVDNVRSNGDDSKHYWARHVDCHDGAIDDGNERGEHGNLSERRYNEFTRAGF